MAFQTINSAEIDVGEPVTASLGTKIKNSFDDHESRLSATELGLVTRPAINFTVVGAINSAFSYDGLLHDRVDIAITLTALRVIVYDAGTSGTLTIDVEYKRGEGAWTSILSAPVSIDSSGGDLATATGTLTTTALQTGDYLRLNVDAIQIGIKDFAVLIENEVT